MDMLLIAAIAVAALLILIAVGAYNRVARMRHRTANARQQVEVQLARRHDLIPNLVEVVKGAMAHERETLAALASARHEAIAALQAGAGSRASSAAETRLSSLLGNVISFVEAQPDLKALGNVRALQEELGSTENRIAFARQHYNDAASAFNLAREQFPTTLFARGAEPAPLWEMPEGSGEVPKVDLRLGMAGA
jgi:LemA protein